ncbi:MAG: sigma-54-dependent Fis family transcriptional regulator [Verrucomicrobia bacterium]|nr:sigma-54-dependent Fis family transcriptional regulator [Verrucomicrobiota bacterium]
MKLSGSSLLLLEDEPLLRRQLAAGLAAAGVEVTPAATLAEARRLLDAMEFDYALLDLNLPDGRSTELLEAKAVPANVVTIVMTADGGIGSAVEAIRLGAADYLVKPFDPEELGVRFLRARRERDARRGAEPQAALAPDFFFGSALAIVEAQLQKILAADRRAQGLLPPVLIEGETGTGKTSLARWLHRHGPRATGPLVELNCSAVPESLAESELFGHERGAFTDAKEARLGLLEAAEGGTLFLDELPSLAPALQAKLLKAIEDREIRRVGGHRTRKVDVRIIAATNADLRALAAAGRFREDLLHRLDLFRVRIPPLRERGPDIIPLAEQLVARIARRYGFPPRPIPPIGRTRLQAHAWPGNVRELAHEIERSLVFGDDQLQFSALPAARVAGTTGGASWVSPDFQIPAGFSLESAIDALVARALQQAGGNVSAAARLLGVTRDFVRYRLKQTGDAGKSDTA